VLINEDQIEIFNDQNQSDLVRRKSIDLIIDQAQSLEMIKINVVTGEDTDSKGENVEDESPEMKIPEFEKKNENSGNYQIKPLTATAQKKILEVAHQLNQAGLRVICVAIKKFEEEQREYGVRDEKDLIVVGFIAFLDPPKPTAIQSIEALREAGISIKVLTGDNELVAKAVCQQVGINTENIVIGVTMNQLTDAELLKKAGKSSIFCKLTPSQKKRIVTVLQSAGNVVGFLGDGINDSPALRAADVGITVDNAVDIAKESADIILLEKSLLVLGQGVKEGRTVFGNIIKYIKMGSSSNFGNVFSVTGASILLPFIPMQPVQLLIQNLLYDFSQCGIPFDHVDKEYISKPRKWQIADIAKFMICIGPISSIFDFCTFGLMWFFFHANTPEKQALFQTGWFIEGLVSQTLIVHVIRTSKIPFIQSRASKPLLACTIIAIVAGITLIYLPFARYIPFEKLPEDVENFAIMRLGVFHIDTV
jgi:Mg2+-importing ATPase